jgi:protein-disulfide isomerase
MDNLTSTSHTDSGHSGEAGAGRPSPSQPSRRIIKRPAPMSSSLPLWLAMPLVFLLGLGSGWLFWGNSTQPAISDNQVTIDKNVKRYDIPIDNSPSQGPEDAPITIVEFSDYQCPFCVRWYNEVYGRLLKTYAGKIRFVYRDFPLSSIHPEAQPAAEAARCAGEQDAYWQFHDALFGDEFGLGKSAYSQYASAIGLDVESFNQCVNERRYQDEVEADARYASSIGVSSTPTFFVNGLAIVGAQPYEVFQQVIDKELAGENPK